VKAAPNRGGSKSQRIALDRRFLDKTLIVVTLIKKIDLLEEEFFEVGVAVR